MSYFIRVDAETKVAYKLIAERVQKPLAGEQQTEESVDQVPGEITNPADLQGKPRSITFTFSIPCLSMYLCIYIYRNCMKP